MIGLQQADLQAPCADAAGSCCTECPFANQLAKTQHGGDKVKMMIKAVNGGGGRGMRVVENLQDRSTIEKSFHACAREAKAAFNDERLYAERFLSNARHIEVQIVGDLRDVH